MKRFFLALLFLLGVMLLSACEFLGSIGIMPTATTTAPTTTSPPSSVTEDGLTFKLAEGDIPLWIVRRRRLR